MQKREPLPLLPPIFFLYALGKAVELHQLARTVHRSVSMLVEKGSAK